MDYTISIGSNEQRRENMELARRRLTELFSGIRFSEEEETAPLFFHRPNLFSNQVACFASDNPVEEVTACLMHSSISIHIHILISSSLSLLYC